VTATDVGLVSFLLALGYPFAIYAFLEIAWRFLCWFMPLAYRRSRGER
jgi:hypothetical protein